MTGCEGYVESLASGLVAALAVHARLKGLNYEPPPTTTLLGALLAYLRDTTVKRLTPMNVNFGLLPPLENPPRKKVERKVAYAARAAESIEGWAAEHAALLPARSTP